MHQSNTWPIQFCPHLSWDSKSVTGGSMNQPIAENHRFENWNLMEFGWYTVPILIKPPLCPIESQFLLVGSILYCPGFIPYIVRESFAYTNGTPLQPQPFCTEFFLSLLLTYYKTASRSFPWFWLECRNSNLNPRDRICILIIYNTYVYIYTYIHKYII
jgi:hypothetical protein